MKASWSVHQLGDVAKVSYGYTAKASFDACGPKFLRITDIQEGAVNWENVPTCPISDEDYKKQRLKENDIVFARTGATTGKSFRVINPPNAVAASYLIRLRLHDPAVDPAFVSYFFQTATYWNLIEGGTTGSAQGGFNASKLAGLRLPIPPLPEQQRIVAILDEAFEGIDTAIGNTEKNLANVRALFESYLNSVFTETGKGWVDLRLEEITTKIGSGATPRGGAESYKAEGISLIRSLNIYDRRFSEARLAFIDDEQADKLSNVIVEEGDVLFNITGASIARCCIAPTEYLPARVNQHVSILRPVREKILSNFLCYLMTSFPYKKRLLGVGEEGGSTRQAITKSQLQELIISLPAKVKEQAEIVARLDQQAELTGRLEAVYDAKRQNLKDLKQSLLQKAFSGELTAKPDQALKEAVV